MSHRSNRQYAVAVHRKILVETPRVPPPGVVTGINSDGTVTITVGGDPTPVTAFAFRSYLPAVGDRVHVEKRGRTRIVHDAYATGADFQARQQAPSTAPPIGLVQGETALIGAVLWGTVPDLGAALFVDASSPTVVTNSSGAWTLTLDATYLVGYTVTACSGASGDASVIPLNQALCNATTLSGRAYDTSFSPIVSSAVVVSYSVLGA